VHAQPWRKHEQRAGCKHGQDESVRRRKGWVEQDQEQHSGREGRQADPTPTT
jgi:hypothetical protein